MPFTIFMDESGDFGLDFSKSKTSRWFIVTFLIVDDRASINKIIKKTFSGFTRRELMFHHGVLHAYKENKDLKLNLLSLIKNEKIVVYSARLDKRRISNRWTHKKDILFNILVEKLLVEVFKKSEITTSSYVNLIVSRREKSKFVNNVFSKYIEQLFPVKVKIMKPENEKCLQIVDLISWSIFRKYEYLDCSYIKIIQDELEKEIIVNL